MSLECMLCYETDPDRVSIVVDYDNDKQLMIFNCKSCDTCVTSYGLNEEEFKSKFAFQIDGILDDETN